MRRRIVIIRGGASGLTAAIGGTRNRVYVTIVGHMDRVGEKVLSTGNGRCNLTNLRMGEDCYHCDQKGFPMEVIQGFGVDETLAFFRDLGIEPKDRNRYTYPNSNQVSAVPDVLRSEAEYLSVVVLLSCHVEKIEPATGGNSIRYRVYTDQDILDAEAAILAAGPKTTPFIGSDGSGYELARGLRYRIIRPLPAPVQLRYQGGMYRQMAGIRTEAGVKLMAADKLLGRDRGEPQLTDYGLSGIPVFQISRLAARALDQEKRVIALVDFMPSWDDGETFSLLEKRAPLLGHKTAEELLTGLLNKKLALILIKLAGIKPSQKTGGLSPKQLKLLLGQMRFYGVIATSVDPFANVQVYYGGADTREMDVATMESGIHVDLYLAEELLDVDGICGGYNLQLARSSSMVAGVYVAGGYFAEAYEADRNKAEAYGTYGPAPRGKRNRK